MDLRFRDVRFRDVGVRGLRRFMDSEFGVWGLWAIGVWGLVMKGLSRVYTFSGL